MLSNSVKHDLTGLAKLFFEQGLFSLAEGLRVQAYAEANELIVAEAVVACELMTAARLAEQVARLFGEPSIDLSAYRLADIPYTLMSLTLASRYLIVPISMADGVLQLAVADPSIVPVWQRLAFQYQVKVTLLIASVSPLRALVEEWRGQDTGALHSWLQAENTLGLVGAFGNNGVAADADGPVAQFIQQTLTRAVQLAASDLHFECYEGLHRVRVRVDGQLQVLAKLPAAVWPILVSRLKIMAQLDITVKRLPQDGRLSWVSDDGRTLAFRVSTVPTLVGEKIALRLLDIGPRRLGLSELGLLPEQYARLQEALARPHGLMLVAGPTGSGKTMTLYACLQQLNQAELNIVTIEDPAEMHLQGVNQINIHDRQGLTFASVLRACLRQDPDVMMVGEIRDLETADIAIKAAQTGHKVFSTVHTHDVCASLTRLLNMGVSAFNVASATQLLLAQRLLPKLCSCKQVVHTPAAIRRQLGFSDEEAAGGWIEYAPRGCGQCQGRGYKGRVGIFELVLLDDELRAAILANEGAADLAQRLDKAGIMRLQAAGRQKVMTGDTSLSALLALLGPV